MVVNTTQQVEFLLKSSKGLRSNDMKLWIAYLVMFHDLQTVVAKKKPYEQFKKLVLSDDVPSMETIRRTRQKIQSTGKYVGVKTKRKKTYQEFTTKSCVVHLLKHHKETRKNDKLLWLEFLNTFLNLENKLKHNSYERLCEVLLQEAPAFSSIVRVRQSLQRKSA